MAMNADVINITLTIALALVSAYIAWVHRRQSDTEKRVGELEKQLAAFGDVRQSLRDMDMKLDKLTRVVYLIAGKEGVTIHDA